MKIHCPNCQKKLEIKNSNLFGRKVKCPSCQVPFQIPMRKSTSPPVEPTQVSESPSKKQETQLKEENRLEEENNEQTEDPLDKLAQIESHFLANSHLKNRLTKKKSNKNVLLISVLLIAVLLLGTGIYFFNLQGAVSPEKKPLGNQFAQVEPNNQQDQPDKKDEVNSEPFDGLDSQDEEVLEPEVKSIPIHFNNLPDGIRFMVYLKPSDILKLPEEKRKSFEPILDWGTTRIKDVIGLSPEIIDSLLIGFIPRSNDKFPHIVLQVRIHEELSDQDLLKQLSIPSLQDISGKRMGDNKFRIYRYDSKTRTIGIFSEELYAEISVGLSMNSFVSIGIEKLLEKTDENSQFTVIWDAIALRSLVGTLKSEGLKDFIADVSDWLSEETEAGLWDLKYGKTFQVQSIFRNKIAVNESKYQNNLQEKLEILPETIHKKLSNNDSVKEGVKTILERFPSMVQFAVMKTKIQVEPRLVVAETDLPEKAMENLMIGSLLFWNAINGKQTESNETSPNLDEKKATKSLVELLDEKVELEFRRTPLKQAFEEIAQVIGVKMVINGNAIKELGYTQNMPQTKKFDKITAKQAFDEILKQYEDMVLVLDEKNRTLLISTVKEAEKNKQEIFLGNPKG